MKHCLLFLLLPLWCCHAIAQQSNFTIIQTDAGKVSGFTNPAGNVHVFKGIPFAAPPVGSLRWKAPQPVTPWDTVRACTQFSASPMQSKPDEFGVYTREFLIPYQPISEDCLYLNIWTGACSSTAKLPVIVYIYGGGFMSGGSAVPIYDGEAMAKKGVVFVSINYRLGIFGFFAHPELSKESGHNASGNYALMDQLAALKWVKKNIAAFGGDPGNVTIAGQSAGSMSVNCLVASPLGKGLFQRAIAESGALFIEGSHGVTNLKQAEESGEKLARSLGANSIADMRNIPAAQLVGKAQAHVIIDGYVLPDGIAAIFAAGRQNDVPVLTGWNADDAFVGPPKNAAGYQQMVADKYGAGAKAFLTLYPGGNDDEAATSQVNINRDNRFGIQNYTWANMQSQHGRSKIFVYRFTRRLPATPGFARYGAFHTGEVAYAYDNLKFLNRSWVPADRRLAATMCAYWVNFARGGNPNGQGLPAWPAYNTSTYQIMVLGEKTGAQTLPDKAALDFTLKEAINQ